MIEKSIAYRVLAWFFDHPRTETGLRELSRTVEASLPSVKTVVDALERQGLVTVKVRRPVARIVANTANKEFTWRKRLHNLETVYESGIIEALKKTYPQAHAITCFGSYANGEDDERSDIDIAVFAPNTKEFDVRPHEKRIGKTVHVTVISPTTNRNLQENARKGMIMEGAL